MRRIFEAAAGKRNGRRRVLALVLVLSVFSSVLTGCSSVSEPIGHLIKETFFKEYILIDTIFDQLEADVLYTLESHRAASELEYSSGYHDAAKVFTAFCDKERRAWKDHVRLLESYEKATGDKYVSIEDIERDGQELRVQVINTFSAHNIIFKTADVERGFFGSLWHFTREYWYVSLLILGALAYIPEKIISTAEEKKKKEKDRDLQI